MESVGLGYVKTAELSKHGPTVSADNDTTAPGFFSHLRDFLGSVSNKVTDGFIDLYCFLQSEQDIKAMKSSFAEQLISVTSANSTDIELANFADTKPPNKNTVNSRNDFVIKLKQLQKIDSQSNAQEKITAVIKLLNTKEVEYLDADENNEVVFLLAQALTALKDEAIEKTKSLKNATDSTLLALKKSYQSNQRLVTEINALKNKAALGAQFLADRVEFISKLEEITLTDVGSKLFNKIQTVKTYLKKDKGCLDEVSYAFVSSMLEAVLIELDQQSALKNKAFNDAETMSRKFNFMPSLKDGAEKLFYATQRRQKVIHTINSLERKAALAVKHLAREKIIDALDAYYNPLFKVGFSRTTTVDASLGISAGLPVGVEAKIQTSIIGKIKIQWFLDDEGYIAIVKTGSIGSATEASADFGIASASISASGELNMGTYYEVKTSRDFVTYLLPELIRDRKHRNDPNIAPYFSRSGILAHAMKNVAQSGALWAVTRNEVDDIDLFKRDSDFLKDHNDMLLSLSDAPTALSNSSDLHVKHRLIDALKKEDNSKINIEIAALKELSAQSQQFIALQARSVIEDVEKELADTKKELADTKKEIPTPTKTIKLLTEAIKSFSEILTREQRVLAELNPACVVGKVNNTKPVKSVALNVSSVTPAEAALIGNSLKFNANAEAGFDKFGIEKFASIGGSAEYTRNQRVLRDITATSICTKLNESNSLIERTRIAQELGKQYRTFQPTLFRNWTKESEQIELSKIGLEIQKMSFDIDVSDETFSTYLRTNGLNQNLTQLRGNNLSEEQRWDLIKSNKLLGKEPTLAQLRGNNLSKEERWNLIKTNNLLEKKSTADLSNERVLFAFLKNDFKFYTDLHVRIAARGDITPQDKKSLEEFAARYGASTKEQFLHRLIIANATLFSQSNNETLKAEMLEFEQAVLSPKFDFDKKYMKEHAYYQEEVNFEVIENTIKGEIKLDVVSLGGSLSFEAVHRERKHINQLRDGDYIDLAFKLNGAVKDTAALAKAVAQAITSKYPPDLAKIILDDITSTIEQIEPTASAECETAYVLRYFKPKAFGGNLPYKPLFKRNVSNTEFHLGIKAAIPIFTGINITGSIGYTNSSTDHEWEEFSSKTFIYALMFGMREYALNTNNERTEKITDNANWLKIKLQQEKFFKNIFATYAQELSTQGIAHGSLKQELTAISAELQRSERISDLEKEQFQAAYDKFQTAVMKLNGDKNNEKLYQAALKGFEEFMHSYSVHWLDRRSNSDYVENGHLPKLEESQIELKARMQAEKRKHSLWAFYPSEFVSSFYLVAA